MVVVAVDGWMGGEMDGFHLSFLQSTRKVVIQSSLTEVKIKTYDLELLYTKYYVILLLLQWKINGKEETQVTSKRHSGRHSPHTTLFSMVGGQTLLPHRQT
jgi:hypothetical protein